MFLEKWLTEIISCKFSTASAVIHIYKAHAGKLNTEQIRLSSVYKGFRKASQLEFLVSAFLLGQMWIELSFVSHIIKLEFLEPAGIQGGAVPCWCLSVHRCDLAVRAVEERIRAVPWCRRERLCLPDAVQPHTGHEVPVQGLQGKSQSHRQECSSSRRLWKCKPLDWIHYCCFFFF